MFSISPAAARLGRVLAAFAIGVAAAAAAASPAAANASPYLSRTQAATATKQVVRAKTVSQINRIDATCYPTDRAHTTTNLHRRWRLWDCGWVMTITAKDGSSGLCTGTLRVWRVPRGTRYRVLVTARCRVTGTPVGTPAPPQPQPPQPQSPQPQPQPVPTGPSQQTILNHTFNFADGVGQAQLSAVTHTYRYSVNGCLMVQSDTGRCTVWRWVDHAIVGTDAYGRDIHQIDFYRIYAFSQWVTTNGVYDNWAQDYDIVDPAQSCLAVDVGNLDNLYNCTAVTPGA